MRVLRQVTDAFTFELEWIERVELEEVLRHYPLTPPAHHRMARDAETGPRSGDQALLEEAMLAQQQALRLKVQELLGPGRRFSGDGDKYLLTLQGAEIEWLLQALNDVRVGCWVHLGCPEETAMPEDADGTAAGYHLLMETALMFETYLLRALHGSDGDEALPEESVD
jgi:hypothetical protein